MLWRVIMAGLISSLLATTGGCTQTSQEQPLKDVRKPAVAGEFYLSTEKELREQVDTLLDKAGNERVAGEIIGLMVPHAGYVFSGQVAAYAFKQLEGYQFDTVVIIGMSHRSHFDGISIYDKGYFETPLGVVKIDSPLANALIKSHPRIKSLPLSQAEEHSLEVEVPFLQRVLDKFEIVPILMTNPSDAKILADSLLKVTAGKKVLFIASSDMTHFPPYEVANQIDPATLSIIEKLDIQGLADWLNQPHQGCDTLLCGSGAVFTLMFVVKGLDGSTSGRGEKVAPLAKARVLKYANSADVPIGNKSRVVGYGAVVFTQEGGGSTSDKGSTSVASSIKRGQKPMLLSDENKKKLLEIARNTIESYIRYRKVPVIEETDDPELTKPCGVFVTLKKQGELRGCIGYIKPIAPLVQAVIRMAVAASTEDPRFSPVGTDELKDIEIEITVLSELTRTYDLNQIEVGTHGLYMVRGYNSGLLLPQVPVEQGWNKEQFLVHTCYKAGLPANAWKEKDTEIYTFTGVIFHE